MDPNKRELAALRGAVADAGYVAVHHAKAGHADAARDKAEAVGRAQERLEIYLSTLNPEWEPQVQQYSRKTGDWWKSFVDSQIAQAQRSR
jgi:hypothetical protein